MSFHAIKWAQEQPIEQSSRKYVLITLASFANELTGRSFPSVETICAASAMERKTVIDGIQWLLEQGYIQDTGERVGKTKRVRIFKLKWSRKRNHPENGIIPFFPPNGPENGIQNSQGTVHTAKGSKPMNSSQPDPDVELPKGFPKTEAEAVVHADFVGCTKQFASETWNLAMGRGGRDSKDVPIRSWRNHLKFSWTAQQGRKAEQEQKTKRPSGTGSGNWRDAL